MRIAGNKFDASEQFYKSKLETAGKYAESMVKYTSKAEKLASKADAMTFGPDAQKKKVKVKGLALKAAIFAIIARYWRHRIHRCADRVENLAAKHLDFWTGTGGVYCEKIRMLDPDYAAKKEREKQKDRERDRHCTHYGGDAYDTSFSPY